jgi:hypothetical protein
MLTTMFKNDQLNLIKYCLTHFSAMRNFGLLKNKVKEGKNEVSFREEMRKDNQLKQYTGTRFKYLNEN